MSNPQTKTLKLAHIEDICLADNGAECNFWVVEPGNNDFQTIKSFSTSLPSKSNYVDDQKNLIHHIVHRGEKVVLIINLEAEVKLAAKREDWSVCEGGDSDRYLIEEPYLEWTESLNRLVAQLTNDRQLDKKSAVKQFFNYVASSFTYQYPVAKRGVANLDFSALKGDCGEYSALFVAMCRNYGVAARNQVGWVVFPDTKTVNEHEWAQIFIDEGVWLDMDTQFASLESKKPEDTDYFGGRPEYRITLTNGYNIPLIPSAAVEIHPNDVPEIPLVAGDSAQCLQPSVVNSADIVTYEERMEIVPN